DAEAAVLKRIEMAGAGAHRFGENDQAGAAVDGVLRQAPHALQVRGAAHVGYRNIAEALHEPTVRRDFEMRFELPAAHKLGNGAVEQERIEYVDVIDHEETCALRVEAGRADGFDACTGEK